MDLFFGAMNAPPPPRPRRRIGTRGVLAGAVLISVLGSLA